MGNEIIEEESSFLKAQKLTLISEDTSKKTEVESKEEFLEVEEKSFTDRWKTNRFWLVRGTYYVLYSIWMIVMVVAGFIAWLISFLFI